MIALILRFYNGAITLEDVKKMSFEQLNVFMKEMEKIGRFESGEAPPLSPEAQREIAQAMFGRKKKDG